MWLIISKACSLNKGTKGTRRERHSKISGVSKPQFKFKSKPCFQTIQTKGKRRIRKKKEKRKKEKVISIPHFPFSNVSFYLQLKEKKKKKKPKIQQTLSLLSHRSVRSPKSRARVSAFNDQKFRPFLFLQKDRSETKRHYSELRSLSLSLTELCDLPKEISTTFSHTIVL